MNIVVAAYRIADLLPAAAMTPRTMPAIAILSYLRHISELSLVVIRWKSNMNYAARAILDQIEDSLSTESVALHDARAVSINNYISLTY